MSELFGWIPPDQRNRRQSNVHQAALLDMPKFNIIGRTDGTVDKVFLFDLWKHELTKKALGYAFDGTHQLTGSCFPAGTQVRMSDGNEKSIEDVQVGDEVITHKGRSRKVTRLFKRKYTGEIFTVKARGLDSELTMTSDHKLATMESNASWRWQPDNLEWTPADELTSESRVVIGWDKAEKDQTIDALQFFKEEDVEVENDTLRIKGSRYNNAINRYIPVTVSFARLIGLYLAEGGSFDGKTVFSMNNKEEHIIKEIISLVKGIFGVDGVCYKRDNKPTVIQAVFSNVNLAKFFKELIPGNVYSKRVPGVFFSSKNTVREAIILGWLTGDGYFAFKQKAKEARIQGVTVCQNLARDMTTLGLSVGMKISMSSRKARKQSKKAYDVYFSGAKALTMNKQLEKTTRENCVRITDNDTNRCEYGYCRQLKYINRKNVVNLDVYDFEVEKDHSFIANGIVCHNCVGAGGGNTIFTVIAVDSILRNDRESIVIPYWLIPYGRSRYYCGMTTPGEGSMGSAFAKAAKEDGVLDAKQSGLPTFENSDGLIWGEKTEYSWSDGDARQTMDLLPQSRKHLIKTTAQCKNYDDVREALINGYPCTCASSWGGLMQCPVTEGVLLSRKAGTWNHQQSIQAWWNHPKLGEIFWVQNQWGKNAHGKCPSGAPEGGYWVKKGDIDWMCNDGQEIFAFSQFEGFPSQTLPKELFKII